MTGAASDPGRAAWLLCRAGAHLCAIPIERVIETMRAQRTEPVAGGPPYVLGLSLIRGAPVAVVDTGLLIGGTATRRERFITIKSGERTIALVADAVVGISAVAPDKLGQLPPLLRDAAPDTIEAVGTRDAELLFFLRTARLVPDDLLDRLAFAEALS